MENGDLCSSLFLCTLCRELFDIPMLNTVCGHIFCRRCISHCIEKGIPHGRRGRITRNLCPTCHGPAFLWQMCRLYVLENCVSLLRASRNSHSKLMPDFTVENDRNEQRAPSYTNQESTLGPESGSLITSPLPLPLNREDENFISRSTNFSPLFPAPAMVTGFHIGRTPRTIHKPFPLRTDSPPTEARLLRAGEYVMKKSSPARRDEARRCSQEKNHTFASPSSGRYMYFPKDIEVENGIQARNTGAKRTTIRSEHMREILSDISRELKRQRAMIRRMRRVYEEARSASDT